MPTTEEIYSCILLLHWFICIEGFAVRSFESNIQDELVVVVVVVVVVVLVVLALPLIEMIFSFRGMMKILTYLHLNRLHTVGSILNTVQRES